MDNKKNTILLTVIAVATLLVAVVGATFAYFTAQGGEAASKNVTVQTGTAGNSSFAIDGAINIYADATSFAQGKDNATDSSNGTVSFTAPGAVGGGEINAKDLQFCYSVSLNITGNDFGYTVNETTPELTLDVTKDGTAVITAMDITTKTGKIGFPTVVNGSEYVHKITAAAPGETKTEAWKTTVTLINLDSDQNANTGKNLAAVLKFEKATCPSA